MAALAAVCIAAMQAVTPVAAAEEPTTPANLPTAADLFVDQPKGLSDHYTAWKFVYWGEVLGNPTGGESQGAIYEGYVKLGLGVNLDRALGWEGASLYANVLYPHGASLTQNFVHDLNVISNIDGYDSVRLYKLFFQKNFAEGRFSFRVGQMAADKEFFTIDTAGVFFNSAFGTPAVFGLNITGPIFPVSAPGVRLRWDPSPAFSLRTAVFSGDVGRPSENQHETRIRLHKTDGALALVEAAYKTHQSKGDEGLPTTFKLGGFYDSKWFDNDRGDGREHGNAGGYFVVDQQVYHMKDSGDTPRGLAMYSRLGLAPRDRNLVNFEYEGGLNYVGLLPQRPKDIAGLGVVYTHVSDDIQPPPSDAPAPGSHESVLEATYLAPINDQCTLQPDIQYIMHPGANALHRNALVLGLRFTLSY
jgi:porin